MNVGRALKLFGAVLSLAGGLVLTACSSESGYPRMVTAPTVNVPYSQTDVVVGTGATATPGHMALVNYTGWIYDPSKADFHGEQFDSANSFGFVLGIGSVIKGWDQGIPGMKVGGTRTLVIPPDLAYGAAATGKIPSYSTLIFTVTLVGAS